MSDRLIYDPTSNAKLPESEFLMLQPAGGYTPVQSPRTGAWFALQSFNGHAIKLDLVADDHKHAVMETILRHELTEEIVARCEQIRANGETVRRVTVSESRHEHVTRAAVFSQARSRGYSADEVHFAYETLDESTKLADADLGATTLKVGDDAAIAPLTEDAPEDEDAADPGSDD